MTQTGERPLFSKRKNHWAWITPACVSTLLSLVSGPALAARDTRTDFTINSAETELVTGTASECVNGEPGCKEARRNQKLKLKMRLGGDRDCSRAPRAEWRLQAVYLGGFNSADKPTRFGNLPSQVTEDFDVDAVSGLVIPQSSGEKKIDFFNQNKSAYTIWYKVTAVCVDREGAQHGEPISSDPRIINRGTGVN
jgi:hypothetical protein